MMEAPAAVAAFGALAQETRLEVFRLLVRAGPGGMTAGDIAETLKVPASTMSHHLATIERAGLATSRRESRSIFYAADYEGTRKLLAFLMEDCCQGRPEICGTGLAAPAATCEKETCR